MTPQPKQLAERVSTEMNSGKRSAVTTQLCLALDDEHRENHPLQIGGRQDRTEHLMVSLAIKRPSWGWNSAGWQRGQIRLFALAWLAKCGNRTLHLHFG
jgi:hypothetical protein